MPSINSARYAQRIIQTENHESPSFLRKVHRLDLPDNGYMCIRVSVRPSNFCICEKLPKSRENQVASTCAYLNDHAANLMKAVLKY